MSPIGQLNCDPIWDVALPVAITNAFDNSRVVRLKTEMLIIQSHLQYVDVVARNCTPEEVFLSTLKEKHTCTRLEMEVVVTWPRLS